MGAGRNAGALVCMHFNRKTRRVYAVIAAAVASVATIGILAVAASSQTRNGLLAQLEQPATPAKAAVGTGELKVQVGARSSRIALRVSPDRARVRNALSVRVTQRGRPLNGARVTVTFSMPAMDMWRVFTSQLSPTRNGTYAATEPVLGMAGTWRLNVHVTTLDLRSTSFAVNDRMGA
jgi:hypothetical protein